MTITSESEFFREEVLHNLWIYDDFLMGVYHFVDGEGVKSQPLADVISKSPIENIYLFHNN